MNVVDRLRGWLSGRRTYYLRTFDNPEGHKVLADLAKFCRANAPTFHPDPRVHAVAEGRREVWLRIANHLNLSDDQLYDIYAASTAPKE